MQVMRMCKHVPLGFIRARIYDFEQTLLVQEDRQQRSTLLKSRRRQYW